MIQVPLRQVGQKIGQSGRIDWFRTGKFVQFINSSWMADKLHIKAKVQTQLVSIRNWCELNRPYKKIMISHIVTLIALLAYILYVVLLDPYDDRGNLDPDYTTNIWIGYWIFFLVIVAISAFQIVMFKRIERLVKTSIQAYNMRLEQERANIFLTVKQDKWCQKYWGRMWNRMNYIEVYEYLNY